MIALAAEFPNDNPALHDGVIWVCVDPVGAPIAVREAREAPEELPPASEPEPLAVAEPIVVEAPERRASPREAAPEMLTELDDVAAKLAEVAARLEAVARAESEPLSAPEPTAEAIPLAEATPIADADASPMMADASPMMTDASPMMTDASPMMADASPMMADASPMMTDASPMMTDASPIAEDPVARVEPVADVEPVAGVEPDQSAERVAPRASGIIPIACVDEDDLEEEAIVVEELEPIGEIAEESVAATADPEPTTTADDPFAQLCAIMAEVARISDGSGAAAALPKLLLDGVLDPGVGADALAALTEGGLAENGAPTPALVATVGAWRAVLSGASDDLSACGGATLDEWAADVLARLLGAVAKASSIRRELRSRGVAAFGLLEAA